jgi:hypothetical protein
LKLYFLIFIFDPRMTHYLFYTTIAILVLSFLCLLILYPRRTKAKLVISFFINNQKQLTVMKLNKKQIVEAILSLQDEQGNKIDTIFSNVTFESSDEGVFKLEDADSDGDLDIVPIAAGTALLKVSAVADYIDPATGERVVAGKDAPPAEIIVQPDPTTTKLVVDFNDPRELPVVTEGVTDPTALPGNVEGENTETGLGKDDLSELSGHPNVEEVNSSVQQEENSIQEEQKDVNVQNDISAENSEKEG